MLHDYEDMYTTGWPAIHDPQITEYKLLPYVTCMPIYLAVQPLITTMCLGHQVSVLKHTGKEWPD